MSFQAPGTAQPGRDGIDTDGGVQGDGRTGGEGKGGEGKGTAVVVSVGLNPGPEVLRAWDRLVDRTPGTDVTQFSTWARLRRQVGYTPIHVLAHHGGELVGGAQILGRRVPALGAVGYLPYGPLVSADAPDGDPVTRALADALVGLCRGRLRMLFVQPPEGAEAMSDELLRRGFRPSSSGIAPTGSIRIDLTADLAEIRSRFGKRLKSWTNRWPSRGVTVRVGNERDVALLVDLMATSSQHQGYQPLPAEYVATLYRELAATDHVALFVGEVNGVPVAADLVTRCGGMVRGRLSGFDRREETARLSVPAAIRWEILQWAKARGYHWLDFGGLHPKTLDALLGAPAQNGAERGGAARGRETWPTSDQPKVTFGGTPYRYPVPVEMIRPAPLRMAYDLAWCSATGRRWITVAKNMLRGSQQGAQ
ncbi:MAG: lipid II:glycine glycyltransferase FemX [Pseudonocardiaceae bacterium]